MTEPADHPEDQREDLSRHILRAAAIEAMAGVSKVHFLNPKGKRVNKSLGDATGLSHIGVHLIEVPPGAESTEAHRHHHEDEAVYVLSGRGGVTLDDQRFEIQAGDFVGLPAGGPAHVFENTGDEPLRCLVIGERRAVDVADYPRLGKRLFRIDGQWSLVEHDAIVDPKAGPGSTVGKK